VFLHGCVCAQVCTIRCVCVGFRCFWFQPGLSAKAKGPLALIDDSDQIQTWKHKKYLEMYNTANAQCMPARCLLAGVCARARACVPTQECSCAGYVVAAESFSEARAIAAEKRALEATAALAEARRRAAAADSELEAVDSEAEVGGQGGQGCSARG